MRDAGDVCLSMRGERNEDAVIASLAGRQFGVVARRQLITAGVGRSAIDRRLRRRVLQRLHRGVYAFGHATLTAEGRWLAAVLAAGPGAVLSHRSAGALWLVLKSGHIDVTVRGQNRPIKGVRFHRSQLPRDEITTVRGIPVTTVPRTLLDLSLIHI